MAEIYKHQTIYDAVTEKFGEEPRLIMRLREEEEGRIVYRVFWDEDKPSTVVVAVWNEARDKIKFINEAVMPQKGGVELGV